MTAGRILIILILAAPSKLLPLELCHSLSLQRKTSAEGGRLVNLVLLLQLISSVINGLKGENPSCMSSKSDLKDCCNVVSPTQFVIAVTCSHSFQN